MSTVKISVKWSGKKFDNVEVDTTQQGIFLKAQLYTLTGVEPERQKIMAKGGILKDDTELSKLGLKEGQTLMMMGTAGDLPKAPPKPVQFVEDMTDAELAQALKLPAGLENLGNTCYMNATLQCLRAIPELQTAMSKMPLSIGNDSEANLIISMRRLFDDLEKSGDSVPPLAFINVLRSVFPQFAEADRNGFMQQDAEECWGQIIHALADKVPGISREGDLVKDKRFVDQFMTGELLSTLKCEEAPEEQPVTTVETFNKLRVNIGSGVSTYMVTDIGAGLVEKIEKNSPTLNRSAVYEKRSHISRLPFYLTTNFIRFQWKPSERVKAKILKKVKFPFDLDMSEFCTTDLQEKLRPAKLRLKEVADQKAAESKKRKSKEAEGGAAAMDIDQPSSSTAAKKGQLEVMKELGVDESLVNDVGANVSGQYDLIAVLTHVGRAADSGHYIGWVKGKGEDWWKFDDDKVSQVKEEDITKLEGGGDWHTGMDIGLFDGIFRFRMLTGVICHISVHLFVPGEGAGISRGFDD
ncbi:Ubiquitin carboxyl-terminal hydrolase 14 [Rhizophlyctis rosea]|nr:Ubiquitin carboxyl-terminal hydrolase 14 [Rhizophlyctis rosea]